MDALQRTTRTDIAAGVFLPLVQAAMQDRAYSAWLSSCRSRPQLVTPPGALAGALALGGELTDQDVRDAIETDLTLTHRCEVTALQPSHAAYPLLAVLFHGDIILPTVTLTTPQVRPADPVDLVLLGPLTVQQYEAVNALRFAVGKMLVDEARHDVNALSRCTGEFQRLAEWARTFPGRAGLLYSNVLAANIKLCIRGARPTYKGGRR